MKKQTLIILAVVFTTVVFAGNAFSGNYGCGKRERGGRFCQELGAGCGFGQGFAKQWATLSEDQKQKINALHQKFIDETAGQRAAKIAKHGEMRVLMGTSSPDRAKLVLLAENLSDLKKELMIKRIDFALEAKKIAPGLDVSMGFGNFARGGKMGFHRGMKMGSVGCPALEKTGANPTGN